MTPGDSRRALAEDARLIEFMLPGHVDLGLTRGLVNGAGIEEALLDGRRAPRRPMSSAWRWSTGW